MLSNRSPDRKFFQEWWHVRMRFGAPDANNYFQNGLVRVLKCSLCGRSRSLPFSHPPDPLPLSTTATQAN